MPPLAQEHKARCSSLSRSLSEKEYIYVSIWAWKKTGMGCRGAVVWGQFGGWYLSIRNKANPLLSRHYGMHHVFQLLPGVFSDSLFRCNSFYARTKHRGKCHVYYYVVPLWWVQCCTRAQHKVHAVDTGPRQTSFP